MRHDGAWPGWAPTRPRGPAWAARRSSRSACRAAPSWPWCSTACVTLGSTVTWAIGRVSSTTCSAGWRPGQRRDDVGPKFIFVTGGVVSSLGKGLAAASMGALLEARGYRVALQKMDPYINVDA